MPKISWEGSVLSCTPEQLELNGRPVPTSSMERRLLLFFIDHPDTVFTREKLLREVWGYEMAGITRTVDTHVKNLRAHMGDLAPLLTTVRGVGYRLDTGSRQAHLCRCA